MPETFDMPSLEDVTIRERQLEAHLLHSPEYLLQANRELRRQVSMLYLAIVLLFVFQSLFAWKAGQIPVSEVVLISVTSFLAIINCLLLIRTKACLRRLNDAWLRPEQKTAVYALRMQRSEMLSLQSGGSEGAVAHLN